MRAGRLVPLVSVLVCVLALGLSGTATAAPADVDPGFGGDGIVNVEGPSGAMFAQESAARMAIGPKDEIFVLRSDYQACDPPFRCTVGLTVARYEPDGRRDTTYAAGPQLTLVQNAFEHGFDLAVGADGRPVIAASTDDGSGLVVARLGREGYLDGEFGLGGRVQPTGTHPIESTDGAPAVAVQPDGMVIVAAEGAADRQAGTSELLVARYLSTGQLDPGFGSGGETTMTLRGHSRPNSVLLGAAGTIAIPAPQCCVGGTPVLGGGFNVVRLLSNGQPDPGWPGGGALFYPAATPGFDDGVESAAIGPDGALVLSFEEGSDTGATVGNMTRLLFGGGIDTSFGGGRFGVYTRTGGPDPDDLAVDPEGRTVGVGWTSGQVSIFRLRPGGGADRTFNGGQYRKVRYGSSVKSTPFQVGLQSGGRIVALAEAAAGGGKGFALIGLRGGPSRAKCLGKRATVVGTAGPDELTGTPHHDVIAALGGADTVRGLSGADLICGGKGIDKLSGGPGRDQVKQ